MPPDRDLPSLRPLGDESGNQVLHFVFEDVAPFSRRIVTVRVDLALAESANAVPDEDLSTYLLSDLNIESEAPDILRLAEFLKSDSAAGTARRIFEWVAANVEYSGYLREDRGGLRALRSRKGDCTEYASLFVALSRASGIPAVVVSGYVYAGASVLRPDDFHAWAEFWEGRKWQVSDPQREAFNQRVLDYVALRRTGREPNHGIPNMHRFRASGGVLAAMLQP
ncbi:MAG: hypothetical protein HY900_24630 [Deltaproteobacteria bacterium]|nr:hypothetical protein [Deltaproteobacteria bacterium]